MKQFLGYLPLAQPLIMGQKMGSQTDTSGNDQNRIPTIQITLILYNVTLSVK